MFQFYWPWLSLLFPLPFLLRYFFPAKDHPLRNEPPHLYFPGIDRLKNSFGVNQNTSNLSNLFFLSVLALSWFLLVIACMQPEKVDQFSQIKNKGYDLVLAVDISGSMQALDFSTKAKTMSRLDVTKEVVGQFVLGRRGDRVGLVTFGQNAFVHVPLTLDTLSVSRMLNDTVSGMAGNATAIGDAIGLSVKILRERPEGSRVLILLTDGEDNASQIPPLEAAKLAKQYKIRIYTIGVGKKGPVPFPTQHGMLAMAEMPIDEELLQEISRMTGGLFFRASDQRALESIYSEINQLEKSESNQTVFLIRDPLYLYPLAASMILLLSLSLYQLLHRRITHGY